MLNLLSRVACLGLVGCLSLSAEAAPVFQLSYGRAPSAESCLNESEFRLALSARIGRDPFSARADETLTIGLERRNQTFQAQIEVSRPNGLIRGRRRLGSDAPDCRSLMTSVELAVAFLADPPGIRKLDPESTLPRRAPSFDVVLGGGPRFLLGDAPAPLLGIGLHLGAEHDWFATALEADASFQGQTAYPPGRVLSSVVRLTVMGCTQSQTFGFCPLARAGTLWGEAEGFTENMIAQAWTFSVGARLSARWQLAEGPWGVEAFGDIAASLLRNRFLVGNSVLWSSPPTTFSIGAELRWLPRR